MRLTKKSIIVVLAFILIPIFLNLFHPLRIVTGYFLIFFIPGYLLVSIIFREDELNEIEVIGFSFGLSACLSGFGGLLLYHLWGISTLSVVTYLILLSIVLSMMDYGKNNIWKPWKPKFNLRKTLAKFSPIFFLCLFVFIIASLPSISYDTLRSSGDVKCYLSATQKIINGLPPTEMEYLARPGFNGYFFEVLFAMLHFATGLSAVTLYQIGSSLYIFILPVVFYTFGKALSDDHRIGILSAFICTVVNPEFVFWYVFTKPLVFSLIPFLLFIVFMVKCLDEKTPYHPKMFITGLMLAMTITTHPHTGLAVVFFIFFYMALFTVFNINRFDKLKIFFYRILVITIIGISISAIFSWPILSYLISTHVPQTNLYRSIPINTNSYGSIFFDGLLFPFTYEFDLPGRLWGVHSGMQDYKIICILGLIGLLYSIRYKRFMPLLSLFLGLYLLSIHDVLKLGVIPLALPPLRMAGYLILILGLLSSIALVGVIIPWINALLKSGKPSLRLILILSILLLIVGPYAYNASRLPFYFFSRGLTQSGAMPTPFYSTTEIIVADFVSRNTEYDSVILSDETIEWLSNLCGRRIVWSRKYVNKLDTQDVVLDAKERKEDSDIIFNSTDIAVILPKLQKHQVSYILTRSNNPVFFNSTYFSIKGRKEGYTLFEVIYR